MKSSKLTYFPLLCLIFLVFSCRTARNVPEGKFLLKKNTIKSERSPNVNEEDALNVLRQQTNRKTIGIPFRLIAYNQDWFIFDSTRIAEKRVRRNLKIRRINKERVAKQNRINQKRIKKAQAKNREWYTFKIIPLKDSLEPKLFFAEWLRYKYGEPPVVFDTALFSRSKEQLRIFLKKKGYYEPEISAKIDTNSYKRKVSLEFDLKPNKPYVIDSFYIIGSNSEVISAYQRFQTESNYQNMEGQLFDSDMLNDHRSIAAKYIRDEKIYGFVTSNITYKAKLDSVNKTVQLGIVFGDRPIQIPNYKDSVVFVKHKVTEIRNVYFHVIDTINFDGNFAAYTKSQGLDMLDNGFLRTYDTLYFQEIYLDKSQKKKRNIDPHLDTLNKQRFAYFLYNSELSIKPGIIEIQNYLEHDNYYKEYYLERTYTRLIQLDLFQTIKPVLVEIPESNLLDVHYYLVPAKKQAFSFEPRASNSNGLLGVSASVNYNNRNLFRGSQKLTISFSGGFESQPPVFQGNDNTSLQKRTLNTIEIGPSVKLDLPGLFPFSVTRLSKRQRPRTILSVAYNYQKRVDFSRSTFQLNFYYQFYSGKAQVFKGMFLIPPVIKFVSIDNLSDYFKNQLNGTNDLFLRNAYSDQFVWQDAKLGFEFNNKAIRKGKTSVFFSSNIDNAGLLYYLSKKDTNENGQRMVFGVPYSNFVRIDNELVIGRVLNKKKSIHFRFLAGAGKPYLNTKTSLPYDYSFFAGGTNDNRGWSARSLGPGSYQFYYDKNRTYTQIGDIRLGAFGEFRFSMGRLLKGAVFMDASNIWTMNEDVKRQGGQFSKNFYREIGLTSGVGLRLDFDYFILRFDVGLPITNPALPIGSRWIFQSRKNYFDMAEQVYGADYKSMVPKNPFQLSPHIGIGYPF